MSIPKPTEDYRQKLILDALKPFEKNPLADKLFKICDCLFEMALNEKQLLHEDADNPIEHHTTVLTHMMEIVKTEFDEGKFTWKQVEEAAALAILHDICPVRKITKDMIKSAPPEMREELQKQRELSVPLHMSGSAEMANELLLALNQEFNEIVFSQEEIKFICDIIAIHDNPKLKIKIPKDNAMAVILRESDRLWMVTLLGVRADLERKKPENPGINPDDPKTQVEMVKNNIQRFKEERELYDDDDGLFWDNRFFFHNRAAGEIFKRWLNYWGLNLSDI